MRKLILLITIILFSSCGVQKQAVIPESVTTEYPELYDTSKAEIGLTLVSKESGYRCKAIKITKGKKIKPGYTIREIKEGDVYLHDSYTDKYDLYRNPSEITFGIAIPRVGGNPITYSDSDGRITFNHTKSVIEYTYTKVPVPKETYFKQEFIYNGRVGNALKFVYREYVNEIARPAFTQDLQYDLSESTVIGFRGLRIDVLNATNTYIEYKVLSQFDK